MSPRRPNTGSRGLPERPEPRNTFRRPNNRQRISFKPIAPPGPAVGALLGDGAPKEVADSGWSVIPRPRWVGFTEWEGFAPYRLTLPILFDGWRDDRSVERDIERLRQMMRPASTPRIHTPIIRIKGPVQLTSFNWVIESLEPGDALRREDGSRVRAAYDVTLLQHFHGDVLYRLNVPAAERAQDRTDPGAGSAPGSATSPANAKVYTVKSGDTLSGIAARELGNANRWREIADLNGIRDPRLLQVGQQIRLP